MATLFVGDVHGCFSELQYLLQRADFVPGRDTLWLTGDLVARGPESLRTLRFVKDLGEDAKLVLGNHELNLLAVDAGLFENQPQDQIGEILRATDCRTLLEWLRRQPLLLLNSELPILMVHAGLSPQWDFPTTLRCARAVEETLQGSDYVKLLALLHNDTPDFWSAELSIEEQLQYTLKALTRMRYCYPDARLEMSHKGPPTSAPEPLIPWFNMPQPAAAGRQVIFGHWSTLDRRDVTPGFYAMDSGCIWQRGLTLLRWEDQKFFNSSDSDLDDLSDLES